VHREAGVSDWIVINSAEYPAPVVWQWQGGRDTTCVLLGYVRGSPVDLPLAALLPGTSDTNTEVGLGT
jgi:hypothetical protein